MKMYFTHIDSRSVQLELLLVAILKVATNLSESTKESIYASKPVALSSWELLG